MRFAKHCCEHVVKIKLMGRIPGEQKNSLCVTCVTFSVSLHECNLLPTTRPFRDAVLIKPHRSEIR